MGSATLIAGSIQILSAGAQLTVASVETAGEIATIVLRDASRAAEFSITLSAAAVETLAQAASEAGATASLAVGASIATVAVSTGVILVDSAGAIIGFIPNVIGKAMFHHSKHADRRS